MTTQENNKVRPGELLTLELASLGEVPMQATAQLIRVLGAKWGITQDGYEVVLAVAGRYGSPEFYPRSERQPAGTTADAPDKPGNLVVIADHQKAKKAAMLELGEPLKGTEFAVMRDGVAVLPIEGTILPRASFFTQVSGLATLQELKLDLGTAARSPQVKAIVLAVDSPGGALADVNEFSKYVLQASQLKPVIAYTSNMMASAAFWIGSAANLIMIDETADVGSVGVIMSVIRQTEESKARRVVFISAPSPNKALDPDTPEGRSALQAYVDEQGENFVQVIMANRGLTRAQVLAPGGGLLIGRSAIRGGFADKLGTLEDAIAYARKLANSAAPYTRGVAANNSEADHEIIRRYAAR